MKVIKIKRAFKDERGEITDILENELIDSVTIIFSKKLAVRGNHYHKKSIQYAFVLRGRLKLLTQMPDERVKTKIIKSGNLVYTPPMERHTLVALEDSEILVLTRGPRGGKSYEKDTYRLKGPEILYLK